MFKLTSAAIVLVMCTLGARYLLDPGAWNHRRLENANVATTIRASTEVATNSLGAVLEDTLQWPAFRRNENPVASACNVPRRNITQVINKAVYRWTDESGQLHFSDEPTANASIYDLELPVRKNYFNLTIDYRGRRLVPFLRTQLTPQVTGIYQILAQLVGETRLRQVEMKVVLFPDKASYHRYALEATGDAMLHTGGFYTPRRNEAVTWVYEDDKRTLEVARHEASHVIAHGIFGVLPVWLNEGLAEYFEHLSIRGQYTEIAIDEPGLRLAKSSASSPAFTLRNLLHSTHEQWQRGPTDQFYALSWGLVFFLMDSDAGKQSLAQLLQMMADAYCQPVDSTAELQRTYPGGIDGLQRDFQHWLRRSGNIKPHGY